MKTHKYTIVWLAVICPVSLIVAYIFDMKNIGFWANVFIGVFSSGILVLGLSVIGYHTERKKTLEEFLSYAYKAAENYNQFENSGDPQYTMNIVLKMNEFDYSPLDSALGSIDFLFAKNTDRSYIFDIYKRIKDLSGILKEKSWHFKQYKTETGNLTVMKHYIEEIDKEIMSRTTSSSFNMINKEITDELNGRYFEIIYGRKAKAKLEGRSGK